jgi:hypothetical protein
MKRLQKYAILYLVFAVVLSISPKVVMADGTATEDPKPLKITQNQPRVLTTFEEKLPMSRNTKIVLGALGVAAVLGLAVALAGGGSSDDGGSGTETGSVSVGW